MERRNTQDLLNLKVPAQLVRNPNESLDTNILDDEVEDMRQAILAEPDLDYASQLEFMSKDATMMVSSVDIDDLAQEELAYLKSSKEQYDWQEEQLRKYKKKIKKQYKKSYKRLKSNFKKQVKVIQSEEKQADFSLKTRKNAIVDRFKIGTSELIKVIQDNKKETKLRLGIMQEKIDSEIALWGKDIQKVYVRIELCRSIKDKLPCAYYVVFISLWDRLGGSLIELSREKRISMPKRHGGRYFHNCLRFEETLELMVPPASKIRPSMAISFELFLLKTNTLKYDKPVGYGFFPICNCDFEIIQGQFRVPILKGTIDKRVEKYEDLENKFKRNLDDWLCNMYFETSMDQPPPDDIQLRTHDQFEEYNFAVTGPDGLKMRQQGSKRLLYMAGEVFDGLGAGIQKLKHGNLWITMMVLFFCLWVSRLTHFFGQWCFLNIVGINVTEFEVFWFTFTLRFASNLSVWAIIGILITGLMLSLILFSIYGYCAYRMAIKKQWTLPAIIYKVGVLFGFCMFMDPFITLIESLIIAPVEDNWDKDPFLLTLYFHEYQDSYFYGSLLTVLVYISNMSLSGVVFYLYLLYVHMGGRMLDTYHRLTAQESEFLIPYDSEVSQRYLAWVIKKAHQFKSMSGDVRKVAVAEWNDSTTGEVTTHIAIYTQGRGKSLYRHFLRLPIGAINELSTTNRYNTFAGDDENHQDN